jgi:MFS transporter, ACS family, glucarate transporter
MVFLCILSFLTYFDRVCIVRARPDISYDLGLDEWEMGLVFGAFWLAYAVFELPGGWMGDRYGARITLTRIVLAWSLFTVLTGWATGFVSLLLFRLLFGAGEAGAYPNMARVQASWLPRLSRARAGGLIWLMARFGAAASPFLFGSLLRAFGSPGWRMFLQDLNLPADASAWRWAFGAAGIVGLVWCVAFYWWFRDNPADSPAVNVAELQLIQGDGAPVSADHRMSRQTWLALLTCPGLWAMGFLYLCGSFGWSFFVSWAPLYLRETHDVRIDDSEWMTGLPLFFGGISCLVGGALSDGLVRRSGRKWLGRAIFPACGYSLAAVAMFCLPWAQTAEQACLLMCLAGAGNDFGQGANWATIVDIGGNYAGTAAGFVNMVGNAGNTLQPAVGAIIFRRFGWDSLMAVYAAAFFAAAAMWLFIDPGRSFYDSKEK